MFARNVGDHIVQKSAKKAFSAGIVALSCLKRKNLVHHILGKGIPPTLK